MVGGTRTRPVDERHPRSRPGAEEAGVECEDLKVRSRWHLEGGREVCLGQTAAVPGVLRARRSWGTPVKGVEGVATDKGRGGWLSSGQREAWSPRCPVTRLLWGGGARARTAEKVSGTLQHAGQGTQAVPTEPTAREGETGPGGRHARGGDAVMQKPSPGEAWLLPRRSPCRPGDPAWTDSWGEVAGCSWRC